MGRPVILDLFCGAGGAAMGYARAGFDVVGVDIRPQPRYPFPIYREDARDVLRELVEEGGGQWALKGRGVGWSRMRFDVIHASPPCQRYSRSVSKQNREKHPDLIGEVRELLRESGLPYIIENVPRSPLENPVQLCGSAFGLRLIRHRLFETNFPLMGTPCVHGWMARDLPSAWNRTNPLRAYAISGGWQHLPFEDAAKAMGIDWMTKPAELSEALPPAYTEYIGGVVLEHLQRVA